METNGAFDTTLGALAKPSGLARLQEHLENEGHSASPQELSALQKYTQSEITEEPALDNIGIRVKPTQGGGQFFPRSRRIDVTNPVDITTLSHEIGHAKSIDDPDSLYGRVQNIARGILQTQKGNETIILPLLMTLPLLARAKNGTYRSLIRKILGGAVIGSFATGAPVLYEESKATINSVRHAEDKMKTITRLLPNFLDYVRVASVPSLAYYVTKRFA